MIVPKELDYILSLQKRKDAKERIKKVYGALIYKKGKTKGYFNCPSSYLEKVNRRYYKVIKLLLEHKIIDFQSFNYDDSDLFNQRRKKYYNTENGTCIRYKFLIDIKEGYEDSTEIDFTSLYDNEKWYMKTRYSLLQLGFQPEELNIKRDNFSRRLHTNITGNIGEGNSYKDLLAGGDYYTIDAKTFHPRLLWILLKEREQNDENLSYIFDNGLDFYDYILEKIPSMLTTNNEMNKAFDKMDDYVHDEQHIKNVNRKIAKEAFMSWINGTGYIDEDIRPITKLFPIANNYIRGYKSLHYKEMCKLLQYRETNIFIDDLLNNIPLEFCLTVHDSLIVKKEDAESALQYCKEKYPELIFILEEIKRKS
jgi:hypothetical protein